MSVSAWWVCGDSAHHCFEFGQLGWHMEKFANQGFDKGSLIPNLCQADGCMDSTHLFGPFPKRLDAELVADAYRIIDGLEPRHPENKQRISAVLVKTRIETSELETLLMAQGMAQVDKNESEWHGENSVLSRGTGLSSEIVKGVHL